MALREAAMEVNQSDRLGVWSRDEVTWVEFEDIGCFGPGLADRLERRFPADGFEVFGEIVG